jgi:uncharacterized repeat protein (TIGR03803 family)
LKSSHAQFFLHGTAHLLTLLTLALAGLGASASAQTYKVLFDADRTTGTNTQDFKFTQARDGNLYATANQGGIVNGNCLFGCGQIVSMTPAGVVTPIHGFDIVAEGSAPRGGLTLGTDGNLYGVLSGGGVNGSGSIFKMTTAGVVTILHSFSSAEGNASYPPIQATDGNFYGTTSGGSFVGVLYKLTAAGKFTVLHTFNRFVEGDGGAAVVQGTDGKLYTVAPEGAVGLGTVLQFTTTGTVKILHNFPLDRSEGSGIFTPVQAPDGNFYGVCNQGGALSFGTIWKIAPNGVFKLLYSFNGTTDGQYAADALTLGTDGKLYGLTEFQGVNGGPGSGGTIFQFTTAGVYKVLFGFTLGNSASGQFPNTRLTQDTNGLFYGITANGGGPDSDGTFYSLNNSLTQFITLQSASGKVGAQVSILGQGFSSTSVVKFGGVVATAKVVTGTTSILAAVPAGALTGPITVTTGATTLTSTKMFKVTPTITSFTPLHGPVGTSVVITGTGLTQATKVTFGGVVATSFTVNSDSKITVTVPAGAKTGKIAVTTKGGAATSVATFTVG